MASQLFDISDRVALIAGASRGIGRAIAQGLAEAGATIALSSRTEADLLRAADEIRSLGYRVEVFPADLSNVRQIEALVRDVLNRTGQIDILVNVAGVNCRKPSTEITEQDWDTVLNLNLKGLFFTAQAFMRKSAVCFLPSAWVLLEGPYDKNNNAIKNAPLKTWKIPTYGAKGTAPVYFDTKKECESKRATMMYGTEKVCFPADQLGTR